MVYSWTIHGYEFQESRDANKNHADPTIPSFLISHV